MNFSTILSSRLNIRAYGIDLTFDSRLQFLYFFDFDFRLQSWGHVMAEPSQWLRENCFFFTIWQCSLIIEQSIQVIFLAPYYCHKSWFMKNQLPGSTEIGTFQLKQNKSSDHWLPLALGNYASRCLFSFANLRSA